MLEVRRVLHRDPAEPPDDRAGAARLAPGPPAQQIGGAQLVGVLDEERLVVLLQRGLPEDVKEGHGTGPAPVRAHQGVDLRLAHDDLARLAGRGR